jgi:hypothetical protein
MLANQLNAYELLRSEAVLVTAPTRADEGVLRPMKDPRRSCGGRSSPRRARSCASGATSTLRWRDANRIEIKHAPESIFGQGGRGATMQMRGKVKRQGRYAGRRSDWKKAIG